MSLPVLGVCAQEQKCKAVSTGGLPRGGDCDLDSGALGRSMALSKVTILVAFDPDIGGVSVPRGGGGGPGRGTCWTSPHGVLPIRGPSFQSSLLEGGDHVLGWKQPGIAVLEP